MLTIGETQAISHATEQQTQERRIVNPRRGRFDAKKILWSENADQRPKQRRHQQTAEQREHLSMNFEC